jgi:hypothetical protein
VVEFSKNVNEISVWIKIGKTLMKSTKIGTNCMDLGRIKNEAGN